MVIMTIGTTIDDAFAYGTCFDKISESPGENPRTVTPSEREQRPRVNNHRTMPQSEQEQRESPECESSCKFRQDPKNGEILDIKLSIALVSNHSTS